MFAPTSVEQLASKMVPISAGGLLEREGMVDIVSSVNEDDSIVPNHLRWGVYITYTSASAYSRQC